MANPFLAMNEDFAAQQNPALNPFLSGDFGGAEDYTDNPFAASNPFSDFGAAEYETAVTATTTGIDFFGISEPITTSTANFFSTSINEGYENQSNEPLFSTAPSTTATSTNFFDTTIEDQHPIVTYANPTIQKPTDLDLNLTNTLEQDSAHVLYLSDDENSKQPKRPPPPARPIAPETKDLILSVTGHMELTSTHLLDRIPPTRTPSPVSMRDLHSPSPTPEHAFGDFLTDGEQKKDLISTDENDVNMFDVDDVVTQYSCSPQQNSSPPTQDVDLLSQTNKQPVDNSNVVISMQEPSPKEESTAHDSAPKPPRPGPPVRPPPARPPSRPAPPQKPPPPNVAPQRPPPAIPPHHPPHVPPHVPPHAQAINPVRTNDPMSNDFSLFDAPTPQPHPKPTTKEDILSLYSTPKKHEEPAKPMDFLTDDILESSMEPEQANKEEEAPKKIDTPTIEQPVEPPKFEETSPQPMNVDVENSNVVQSPPKPKREPPQVPARSPTVEQKQPVPIESSFNKEPEPKVHFDDSFNIKSEEVITEPAFDIPQKISPEAPAVINEPTLESNPFGAQEMVISQADIFNANVEHSQTISDTSFGSTNAFASNVPQNSNNIFNEPSYTSPSAVFGAEPPPIIQANNAADIFDDFSAKFESTVSKDNSAFDAFGSSAGGGGGGGGGGGFDDAWGNSSVVVSSAVDDGFGVDDSFDAFLTLNEPPPVPSGTPAPFGKGDSQDSDDGGFNVFIKPREGDVPFEPHSGPVPILAPPPKSPAQAFTDTSPRFNPFDKSANYAEAAFGAQPELSQGMDMEGKTLERTDSQETPPTPLFDDDVSQPLEDFPRIHFDGPGWEVQLRQPNKKKITGQRFWKKIFVKLVYQGDNPVVQLFNSATDKEPFQELPLQACYSVSDIAAQQYDQYGKIFTVKLQYVFYKERPGVRPGQVTKAERITNKLSQFAAYAIQGDYQGVKEFGSDLKKLGLPVEHAPQVSQLFKIGSTTFEDMKQFSMCIEEALFKLNAHRDRALHYKMEEVQITAVDELYVEQDAEGRIIKQIARVRLFFLGFLSGMPDVELGVNDMWRQGKEVVGRHDIIPVATEEWIRLEGVEFHSCVQPEEYQKTRIIRFKPPDACYIELMRFRIRPPKNRELPLQLKAVMCVTGNRVELRADALVPGFTSRSLGQVPCEDVMIRFPIPECWIYLFRVEKHFRYGSVKSAHRRTGKIKGIERFLGAVDTLQESLIEVTSGQAKYEHQHRSIVWRMSRLPKEGQGAYTTHNLVCRMALTSYDQIPEKLAEWCYVEFTMPATQASHTVVRSVSLQNHDSDEPPEKYVRYLARHEYKVGIEHTQGEGPGAYTSATMSKLREEPVKEVEAAPTPVAPSSDSDSD